MSTFMSLSQQCLLNVCKQPTSPIKGVNRTGVGNHPLEIPHQNTLIKECVPILHQLSTINSFSLSGGKAVAPSHSCWKFDRLDLVLICTHNNSYYAIASKRHHFTSFSHLSTLKSFLPACQNLRGRGEGNVSHLGMGIQSLFPLFWPIRHICTVCCSL